MALAVIRKFAKCSLNPIKDKLIVGTSPNFFPTYSTPKYMSSYRVLIGNNLQHVKFLSTDYTSRINKSKKYSDSESDSDLEPLGHRGESLFWRRKIRTFHGILDVNNDGVISFDDFVLLSDRFIELGHLSDKHTIQFKSVLQDLWEKRFGPINPYNLVTVEQYLEDMHHVVNDKHLIRRAHSFLPYLFKAVDKDQSGQITDTEFKLFFECLGLADHDASLAFRCMDEDGNGKVTLKEFVTLGRDFFFTEDERRVSKYFFGPLIQ